MLSHSIPEIQCTSGLHSAILNCGSRPTSDNVGSVTDDSGVVENAGVAVGISVLSHSIPEIHCTSGLHSAIPNCGNGPTSGSVT